MENFIVSARKYRPSTFDAVVGQDSITLTLKNAIRSQHLAQAFLFAGPRGVGKTTCARILAKTINCLNLSEDLEPCNECESCVSFNSSASFNIHELDAASNNSVEDIRSLVDQVRIPPQVGKYKVYIIDEVHMLSQSAFNAFLKTLEEPPAYAKFILATTEKHKIIPTILSRCQIFDFRRISVPDIASYLKYVAEKENVNASGEALHIIAQRADGALRDALSIFDQLVSFGGPGLTYDMVIEHLNVLDYSYYFRMVDHFLDGNISGALLLVNEIIERGFDGQYFVIGLGEHLRNLLVCQDKATIGLLEASANVREKYEGQAAKCSTEFLTRALVLQNQCDVEYKNSNNKRLLVELTLIRICRLSPEGAPAVEKKNLTAEREITQKPRPATVKPSSPAPEPVARPATPTKEKQENNKTVKKSPAPAGSFTISINPENHRTGEENTKTDLSLPAEEEDFSEDQLMKVWTYFTESIARQYPNLYSTLKKRPPKLQDNYNILLEIDNHVQEMDLREKKGLLLDFLRNELRNGRINLSTSIIENKDDETPYGADEKYRAMVKKNPLLKEFKDKLDLELDF